MTSISSWTVGWGCGPPHDCTGTAAQRVARRFWPSWGLQALKSANRAESPSAPEKSATLRGSYTARPEPQRAFLGIIPVTKA